MTELYTSMNRAHMQGMAMKRAKKVVKSRERLEPDEKTGDFRRLAAETEQVTRTWRVYGRWVQNEDCEGVFGLGDPSWVETPGWSSSKYCPLAQESERQLARLQQLGIKYFTQTPDYDCLKEEGGDDSWGQRVHTKGKRMRDDEVLRREGWWGPATAVVAAAQASPPHKLHISMHPLEFLLWLPCHSSIPCPLHLYLPLHVPCPRRHNFVNLTLLVRRLLLLHLNCHGAFLWSPLLHRALHSCLVSRTPLILHHPRLFGEMERAHLAAMLIR